MARKVVDTTPANKGEQNEEAEIECGRHVKDGEEETMETCPCSETAPSAEVLRK